MNNYELAKLIKQTPKKLRATIAGTECYVNIEKADFIAMILECADLEQFDVDVNESAIYIDAKW